MIKKLLLPLYLRAHRLMMKICWNLFIHAPLDRRKVVFSNFNGGGYGGKFGSFVVRAVSAF